MPTGIYDVILLCQIFTMPVYLQTQPTLPESCIVIFLDHFKYLFLELERLVDELISQQKMSQQLLS